MGNIVRCAIMTKKPVEMNEESLKKGLSNLSEHENLPDRLLRIEKDIHFLKIHHWINFIFLMIVIWFFVILGVMLL